MTDIANLLAEVPLFAQLSAEERNFLVRRVTVASFNAGTNLFRYGDPGDSMYVLLSGYVEIGITTKTGEHIVLQRQGPKEFFGEISLLDGGPRTATVVAIDAVEALIVSRADLDELFRLQPAAALNLLAATGSRLRQTTQLLRNISTRNPNQDIEHHRTLIVRVAEHIARVVGSVPFLVMHLVFFAAWFWWNLLTPESEHFDSFPFGFLALLVSLESIILSVFVLLSQNRQADRDRVRNDVEYEVNLKAEMQIAHMHEKVDENYASLQQRLNRIEKKLEQLGENERA